MPAQLPALTLESAIDRSWSIPTGAVLMTPRPPEYLPTRPVSYWGDYWRHYA